MLETLDEINSGSTISKPQHHVVYIASAGHSGSTLLSLFLSKIPNSVNLGEISRVIDCNREDLDENGNFWKKLCTCGESAGTCIYWKKVIEQLEIQPTLEKHKKYLTVLEKSKEIFGQESFIIDSSKDSERLKEIKKIPGVEIKVIHLIKDVRSYIISTIDNINRGQDLQTRATDSGLTKKIKKYLPNSIYKNLNRSPIFIAWTWYKKNKNIENFIKQNNFRQIYLGYEELCLYPDKTLEILSNFLAQGSKDSISKNWNLNSSHILGGNRMRMQKEKNKTIKYDNRWFSRKESIWISIFFQKILKYNSEKVYSNQLQIIWKK